MLVRNGYGWVGYMQTLWSCEAWRKQVRNIRGKITNSHTNFELESEQLSSLLVCSSYQAALHHPNSFLEQVDLKSEEYS